MIVDRRISQETEKSTYNHEYQISHNRYLDMLKVEFLQRYAKPATFSRSLKDFDTLKTIGIGSFAKVFLVRDQISFEYHALKAVDKALIIKKKVLKHLFTEKKVLQAIEFPFVISMDFAFKDNGYIYFVLPFEVGGELSNLLKRFGTLAENLNQFYAAQLVLALEYLHHCCIVHRDLKPENIVISMSGYIKVVDFGFCKVIKNRTWTICGTPEYLAPELILCKGYTYSVDWWALGIIIFEMCAGYPPFCHANPVKLYEKIVSGQFKTPENMHSACKSLVKHLLAVDPMKRYGALKAGVFDIKSHPWFKETNWHFILHQKLLPPYIPYYKDSGDTVNYRELHDAKLDDFEKCLYEKEFENF